MAVIISRINERHKSTNPESKMNTKQDFQKKSLCHRSETACHSLDCFQVNGKAGNVLEINIYVWTEGVIQLQFRHRG